MPKTSCMKGASVHAKNMWTKQLCNRKVRDFAMSLRARKIPGLSRNGPLVYIVFFCKQLGLRLKQLVGRHEWRLCGAQVRWRWMVALIPVNALGVNAWPFCVFIRRGTFAEFHSSPLDFILFWVLLKFSFLVPFLEVFHSPLNCSPEWCFSLKVSLLLNSIQLLVVEVRVSWVEKSWSSILK